jgi:hypothetical protein
VLSKAVRWAARLAVEKADWLVGLAVVQSDYQMVDDLVGMMVDWLVANLVPPSGYLTVG